MQGQGQSGGQGDGGWLPPPAAFPAPARRLALACLVLLLGIDLTIAGVCPFFGGDCLYGLFTLIAGPVLLGGLMGAHLPRLARGLRARLGVTVAGGVGLAGIVLAGHVAAVRVFNGADYGGVLVRPRLLAVGMGLALTYYVGLAAIKLLRPGRG
jgi:hypothetical protein